MSGPSYMLCSVQVPTVREASSGHMLGIEAGTLQFGNSPLPVTWEAPGAGGPEKAAKPPGRRRRTSRGHKATWEEGGWSALAPAQGEGPGEAKSGLEIPASRLLPSCPAGGSAGGQARPPPALHWRLAPRE